MADKGINKVILVGNLGSDPVSHNLGSGDDIVTNLSVATSRSWKNKDGKQENQTEWHRIVFYRQLAEIAQKYLKKGAKVYIEGRLRTRKWQDDTGVERYVTEVIGNNLQMLDRKTEAEAQEKQEDWVPTKQVAFNSEFDEDIPF